MTTKIALLREVALTASVCLLGGAPSHLPTADYLGGYAGTHYVDARTAARWLTWSETDIPTSLLLRTFGVKTILYTDPNRVMAGDPDFTPDEAAYAHDCDGTRIAARRQGQYLMNPRSPSVLAVWKSHVSRYTSEGHFSAILNDDANTIAYSTGQPCHFDPNDWLQATIELQRSLGYPVIYNGLPNYPNKTVSPSIALNETAIGAMMEECYGSSPSQPKLGSDRWLVAETTELRMAQARKYFFCLDNDTSEATSALDSRMYVLASFLLAYDSSSSVLWEMFAGPSRFHVMPEAELVPLRPALELSSIAQLRTSPGIFERVYRQCYLRGEPEGPCVVAVNPQDSSYPLTLQGYTRTLQLSRGGVLDGGSARIASPPPPPFLMPRTAIIAFQ